MKTIRAEAHEKLQHFEEAIADMKEIAELDPTYDQAVEKMRHLEHLAAERQMLLRSERLMAERRAMTKEEFIEMMRKAKNSLTFQESSYQGCQGSYYRFSYLFDAALGGGPQVLRYF